VLDVVDRSEPDWWKAEHGGVVFIIPAAYLEVQGTFAPSPSSPRSLSCPATNRLKLFLFPRACCVACFPSVHCCRRVYAQTERWIGLDSLDTCLLSLCASKEGAASGEAGEVRSGADPVDLDVGRAQVMHTNNSDEDETPVPSANQAQELSKDDAGDSDSDGSASDTDYHSFSDSDASDVPTDAERTARAAEHRMVLEAAGLVLKQEEGRRPPPRPVRRNAALVTAKPRRYRPAPAVPAQRRTQAAEDQVDKTLPLLPPRPLTPVRIDDAYERYETFKLQAADSNRFSVVSTDSASLGPPSPASSSFAIVRVPSRAEPPPASSLGGHASGILSHFLGRSRTPAGDERPRPVISGPISAPVSIGEDGTMSPLGAPKMEAESSAGSGFGSVRPCAACACVGAEARGSRGRVWWTGPRSRACQSASANGRK
jgi:hypothetical protein